MRTLDNELHLRDEWDVTTQIEAVPRHGTAWLARAEPSGHLQQTVRVSVKLSVPGTGWTVGAGAQPPVAEVALKCVAVKAALSLLAAQLAPMLVAP